MAGKPTFRSQFVRLLIFSLVLFLAAVMTKTAAAQSGQPVSDDEVNEVAHDLFCPVCESTPLDVCPTKACADWREIIRTKLSQGETKQQITDYFVEQYGLQVVAEPPRKGFTLAVWIIPIVAVVVGGFFFSRYLQSIQKTYPAQADMVQDTEQPLPKVKPAQDDYTARIESELKERAK